MTIVISTQKHGLSELQVKQPKNCFYNVYNIMLFSLRVPLRVNSAVDHQLFISTNDE